MLLTNILFTDKAAFFIAVFYFPLSFYFEAAANHDHTIKHLRKKIEKLNEMPFSFKNVQNLFWFVIYLFNPINE